MPRRLSRGKHSALNVARLTIALVLSAASTLAFAQNITEFAVPTAATTDLYGMTQGPDGAVWFGESRTAKIGRIASDGTITEFSTVGRPPYQLAAGPDGNIWFADGGEIGRMTTTGQLTFFPVPDVSPGNGASPLDIAAGPEGALWFADGAHRIGRITTSGVVTVFPVPSSGRVQASPYAIAAGPDGNLWYTDDDGDEIGRMTPSGVVTTFAVPGARPYDITAGPDGAMWFTMLSGGVGRITTSGEVRTFAMSAQTWQITTGPDGNVWFTDLDGSVGRITPAGVATRFPVPTPSSVPLAIAAGADGNIWFTENVANKIGRLDPHGVGTPFCFSDAHTLCLNNNRFSVTASYQLTPTGPTFEATAVALTGDTGYFWFFDPANVELVVKVLNGCFDPFQSYWVFAAGLTNLEVRLVVTDTRSDRVKTYSNPAGTAFAPIQDTSAFATCP